MIAGDTISSLIMMWRTKAEPVVLVCFTCVTACLSLFVISCELFVMFQAETNLIPSTSLVTVVLVLAYLTLATYYGLFNISVASLYNLDPSGHSDSYSLLYSARLLTGLASPLCFNFLKLTSVQKTQFHAIMNPLDAIPVIGHQLQTLFPGILAVLCVANFFDVWTKIVQSAGLEDLAFSQVFEADRVENGRKLLQIERNRQSR